jgi:CBS domain-containing protein
MKSNIKWTRNLLHCFQAESHFGSVNPESATFITRDGFCRPGIVEETMNRVKHLLEKRTEFFAVSPETTVHEAAMYLRDHEVRATVVCDKMTRAIGVISQSDISDKVAAENRCPAWIRVSEIMSPHLISVTPESSIDECLLLLEKHGIYHLVVVDPSGRSLGMISAQDILRLVARNERARADLLENWAFPSM